MSLGRINLRWRTDEGGTYEQRRPPIEGQSAAIKKNSAQPALRLRFIGGRTCSEAIVLTYTFLGGKDAAKQGFDVINLREEGSRNERPTY